MISDLQSNPKGPGIEQIKGITVTLGYNDYPLMAYKPDRRGIPTGTLKGSQSNRYRITFIVDYKTREVAIWKVEFHTEYENTTGQNSLRKRH